MTTYRKIHGRAIKSVSTNLSAPSAEGQIWFNTTDNKFKTVVSFGSFFSQSSMSTQRSGGVGGGTTSAMFQAFGLTGPGSPNKTALTEEFNGAGWSTGGTANTARYDVAGTGLQTAGLASGGIDGSSNQTLVEEYNGTSWSEVNDIPAAVKQSNMFGIQTAAVQAGGNGSPSYLDTCILYDGTNWTST